MSGPRGLAVRDPITSLGGCEVTNIQTWNKCIAQSIREPSCGNCLPVSMINDLDTSNKKRIGSDFTLFKVSILGCFFYIGEHKRFGC